MVIVVVVGSMVVLVVLIVVCCLLHVHCLLVIFSYSYCYVVIIYLASRKEQYKKTGKKVGRPFHSIFSVFVSPYSAFLILILFLFAFTLCCH